MRTVRHVSKTERQPWQNYLRAAMQAANIRNAAELARLSGVNESQISRWLRGVGSPDLSNLRRISPVLRVPVLQLMVAAGHLTPEEAKLRDVKPPTAPPVRRGISTDGLDPEQEKALEALVETMRSQNPAAR